MGRKRKDPLATRAQVIVTDQFSVRIDDIRPGHGPFPDYQSAEAYARANIKISAGEDRNRKIKEAIRPLKRKRRRELPSEY